MSQVRIRNLDAEVVQAWKARARRHGTSLESELRALVTDEAFRPRRELARELREQHHSIGLGEVALADTTPFIREQRDELG